jgi:TRAP-type C4-dicarboxylate transport system substrate-binding protein
VLKYVSASWKVGSAYCFYVVMNKQKWESLPPDVQKAMDEFSREFTERWAVEWNNIDIGGRDYFIAQGGQIVPISDAESARLIKAAEPVIEDYKKDLISKGHKSGDIDGWLKFVRERIEYWKGQEKTKKIATSYQY